MPAPRGPAGAGSGARDRRVPAHGFPPIDAAALRAAVAAGDATLLLLR